MTHGNFSIDSYEQFKAEQARQESKTASEIELDGTTVADSPNMSLETLPVDSPWADKIDKWQYPEGKSQYMDGKQSP